MWCLGIRLFTLEVRGLSERSFARFLLQESGNLPIETDAYCSSRSLRWIWKALCAKRKDSPYKVTEKPSRYWIKVKNSRYSQLQGREEFCPSYRLTNADCRNLQGHAVRPLFPRVTRRTIRLKVL